MRLIDFAKWALQSSWAGCNLDGGEIQAKAVECGILIETAFDPAMHRDPDGLATSGDRWLVYSDDFKAALKT